MSLTISREQPEPHLRPDETRTYKPDVPLAHGARHIWGDLRSWTEYESSGLAGPVASPAFMAVEPYAWICTPLPPLSVGAAASHEAQQDLTHLIY